MTAKRVLIVGGVAGGASCATRLRRMDEDAKITLLDRGHYVSFANCGLPYYVGNVILPESKLLLATPELFRDRFCIDVRTQHEAIAIDREEKILHIRDLTNGTEYQEHYDSLVLSPGASPILPAWAKTNMPGVFTVRSIPDSRALREWIETKEPTQAVVIGGGFIGLEIAENLTQRGIHVTMLEAAPQVMPPMDPEMAIFAEEHLRNNGVDIRVGDPVEGLSSEGNRTKIRTRSGSIFASDMTVVAIGVRPEIALAESAGLKIGAHSGIRVDSSMQTSDPCIWAVGDAVEVQNQVTWEWGLLPLAGPANRQGRIAADAICGRNRSFNGAMGTAVCGFFGMTIAMTGATEKALHKAGMKDFETVYLHPANHAGYFPGAEAIHIKLLFHKSTGRILGAQAVGGAGVERRIDVISMAIQMQATVNDLEEADLCYAPQFGSAKDAVNMAGMIASNVMRGDMELAPWHGIEETPAYLLDVREPSEFQADHIPGAVNIPLGKIRSSLNELPKDCEIWVNCGVGQRAYYACRILSQNGFHAKNLSGGIQTYRTLHPADKRG